MLLGLALTALAVGITLVIAGLRRNSLAEILCGTGATGLALAFGVMWTNVLTYYNAALM